MLLTFSPDVSWLLSATDLHPCSGVRFAKENMPYTEAWSRTRLSLTVRARDDVMLTKNDEKSKHTRLAPYGASLVCFVIHHVPDQTCHAGAAAFRTLLNCSHWRQRQRLNQIPGAPHRFSRDQKLLDQ